MQSPTPLLALRVGMTVIAIVALGSAPAIAEPEFRQPAAGADETNQADPASSQSSGSPSSEVVQRSTEERIDRIQTGIDLRQQLNQSRFQQADRPIGVGAETLQLEQEIQQQLQLQDAQELRRNVGTSPSRSLDRLQFEQRIRQQIQPPSAPQSRVTLAQAIPAEATSEPQSVTEQPAEPLDRTEATETETVETATAEAVAAEPVTTQTETAETEPTASTQTIDPIEDRETDRTDRTEPQSSTATSEVPDSQTENLADNASELAPELPTQQTAQTPTPETAPVSEDTSKPEASQPEASQSEASETDSEQAIAPSAESVTTDQSTASEVSETTNQETARPETTVSETLNQETISQETGAARPISTETEAASPAGESGAESPEVVSQTEAADETEDEAEAESTPTPAPKPDRTSAQSEERIDRQNRDYPDDAEAPAPDYLDPNPNPLSFPTTPEEVELAGTQPITIQQAIELALRNNSQLRQAQFQLEQSQAALREARSQTLPTLDASANFTQAGQENSVQSPAPTDDDPTATETDVVYADSTALGADLQVQYPIYTSGRLPALIRASEGQVRLQQLEVERQTEQLILDTALDYYDLQQASSQVNIFTANLTQAEQSLRDAQALERAGVGTRFDVLQAEVDVANARQELTQQLSQLAIARRQLAQRLNVAQTVNLEAADIVEVAGVWDLSLEETIVQAYKNRAELEQQLIQREIAQQQRRAALAQLGPQVSFVGSVGLDNDLDRDPGFLYNYRASLNVQMSLYDGGQARAQADQRESDISIAEAEFENIRDQIRFQVEQSYSQLDANFTNIQTTALAVEQAAEALRLARLRFQAGVGTQTDVLRQQTALAQAQVNNIRAILDYNRAIAQLQRQVSNYPEGYLNEQP